ncbi:MAG: methyl-accepting chemotaxis protein [Blautia sp.]|nr:methyl-accepting chemotaxis protein [Lachnoclostridium sp.]MCM1212600.1 methyl-accepting chemotaxis protein [Blautia sp.]
MNKSIGRKVMVMVLVLGAVMVLNCLLNVSALSVMEEQNQRIADTVTEYQTAMEKADTDGMAAAQEDIDYILGKSATKISGTYVFNAIIVGLMILLVIIMLLIVNRTISRPAKKASIHLNEIVNKIEQNEGDLTQRIPVQTKDEIGQLVNGINGFIETLQRLMQTIQENSGAIMDSTGETNARVNEANQSAMNVSAASQELAASMEEVSAALAQIAQGSAEAFKQASEISVNADGGAKNMAEIMLYAQDRQKETIDSKAHAVGMFKEVGTALQEAVGESRNVEKINELASNILSIASQTNLLALNASIEAARAGEAGKGFAVVADEIRVLADNSRDTANNIQNISALVTGAVEKLSTSASKLLEFMKENVMGDYDNFVEIANRYYNDVDNISRMLTDFASKASHMEESMQTMDTGINDIATTVDESAKGVMGVAEDTTNLVNAISTIQEETLRNQEISKSLQGEVNRFEKL